MWQLRQPIEGDRLITVANVDNNVSTCYVDNDGYVPDSISFEVDGVSYPILSAASLSFGFFSFILPNNVVLKANSTVRVYSLCDANTTETSVTRPVKFKVTNSVITACSPTAILNAAYEDIIRLFFGNTVGNAYNLKVNNQNYNISNFAYQANTTGNITSNGGDYSIPVSLSSASLYSNNTFAVPTVLKITPLANIQYYTVRLGYIEIIFSNGVITYNNYLSGQNGLPVASGITTNDNIEIESNPTSYLIKINGVNQISVLKTIAFTVSGGSVSPSTGSINTNFIWTLPLVAGAYNVVVSLGTNLRFINTINIHSCATANNDNYTGVFNQPFSGNLLTNDIQCLGENSYGEILAQPMQGSVVINTNGSFVFTPSNLFVGTATFTYRLRCGGSFATSEQVSTASVNIVYNDPCFNVVAAWQDTGQFRCSSCVEEKQQNDTNSNCTGNTSRWVPNPLGTTCNRTPVFIPLNEYQCINCVEKRVERDNNTCSTTFNQTRLVNHPNGSVCNTVPVWVNTGETRCLVGVHQRRQNNTNPCFTTATRWVNTNEDNCNCEAQVKFRYICEEDVTITGVEVKKAGEYTNRLISYTNDVVKFTTDIGTFNYVVYITNSEGITSRINFPNYKCQIS